MNTDLCLCGKSSRHIKLRLSDPAGPEGHTLRKQNNLVQNIYALNDVGAKACSPWLDRQNLVNYGLEDNFVANQSEKYQHLLIYSCP